MNATSPTNGTDELDRLFSDFFKSQLKQPWPKAPVPNATASAASEPSELVTTRAAEAPRNAPTPAKSLGNAARARSPLATVVAYLQDHRPQVTLAASVALLLGAGFLMTDQFEPGTRSNGDTAPAPKSLNFLPGSSADGDKHDPLKKMREDKAKDDNGGKIDMGKFE